MRGLRDRGARFGEGNEPGAGSGRLAVADGPDDVPAFGVQRRRQRARDIAESQAHQLVSVLRHLAYSSMS